MLGDLKNNFGGFASFSEAISKNKIGGPSAIHSEVPLQEYTPEEISEMKAFTSERHQPEEWDAFFRFWSMSRRMRSLSRFCGVIASILRF